MKAYWLLFSLNILLASLAYGEDGSLWDSMQKGDVKKGSVESVKREGNKLTVTVTTENAFGDKQSQTMPVCETKGATDAGLTVEASQNQNKLEQAKTGNKPIEFRVGSPWGGCLDLGN